MQLVEAKNAIKKEIYSMNLRQPSEMPEASENEAQTLYITGMRESCPMQYFTSCGVTFEKFVLSPDASLSSNQGKYAHPGITCRKFTAKQAEYLRKRLEEQEVNYPNKDGLMLSDKAINIVLFKPASQFNPMENEDVVKASEVQANINREIPKSKKG